MVLTQEEVRSLVEVQHRSPHQLLGMHSLGKGSLLRRMPEDDWQRFANLRALLAYQWLFPGKKLLFMGGEFGQSSEWDANGELEWGLLDAGPYHRGLQRFVQDLNRLYAELPALWQSDFSRNRNSSA